MGRGKVRPFAASKRHGIAKRICTSFGPEGNEYRRICVRFWMSTAFYKPYSFCIYLRILLDIVLPSGVAHPYQPTIP